MAMTTVTFDDAMFKLVPVEPTNQMTYVGQAMRYESANSIGAIYRAMLAAAPNLPTKAEGAQG